MPRLHETVYLGLLFGLVSCGGGGSGNDSHSVPPPSGQASIAANPQSVERGGNTTINWDTHGAACTGTGGWSGPKTGTGSVTIGPLTQSATFSLSCGSEPDSSIIVSVTDPTLTAPTSTKVVSDSGLTSLDYLLIGAKVYDLAWDPRHSRLLAVTAPDSAIAPSSLLAVDPMTGVTQTVSLGDAAATVDVSKDSQYVYVGLPHDGLVKRFLASDLSLDLSMSVSNNPLSFVGIVRVSPTDARTIAVSVTHLAGDVSESPGLAIVDDGTVRPSTIQGFVKLPLYPFGEQFAANTIRWSVDGSQITVDNMGLDSSVTAQGITPVKQRGWGTGGRVELHGDRLFDDVGNVFSLSGPVEKLGRLPDALGLSNGRTASDTRGKAFSVQPHLLSGNIEDGSTITAYDLDRLTYIDSITFNGAASFRSGKMIQWGDDGLAVAGTNSLLVAHGSFATSGGMPPSFPETSPILDSGSSASSGTSAANYRLLGITARDLVADSCGHLYAATDASAFLHPSSVVEVDFETGAVLHAVHVLGEPFNLAVSDDCTTLYAALDASNSVARIRLSDMTVTAQLPLGVESNKLLAMLRARSVSVAPGEPLTVAIAKGDMDASLCGGTDDGVVIFDDTVKRPVQYQEAESRSLKSIVWGVDASTLYGEDSMSISSLTVAADGSMTPRPLMPYPLVDVVYDLGRDLYFDRNKKRLFTSFGKVFDTAANKELAQIQLQDATGTINLCGTPSATRVADSTSGKVFFVTWNDALTVTAYDGSTLGQIDHYTLTSAAGTRFYWPLRVVRPGSGKLAVVTATGQVLLLGGALLNQ